MTRIRNSTNSERDSLPDIKTTRKRLADGTEIVYRYHRKTGQRIEGEPGTAEFNRSWLAAASVPAAAKSVGRTLQWLIDRYQSSPEWDRLATATREHRRSYFKRLTARFGGAVALEIFENEEIISVLYDWRDEMKSQPWTADHSLDALRVLLGWGQERRHVRHNWASEVKRLVEPRQSRAEKTWTPTLWSRLLSAAVPDEHEMLCFARWAGPRQEDLATLKEAQFDGEWIVFIPQKTARKTRVEVHIPVFAYPPLAELMANRSRASEFLLCTDRGQPWTTSNIKLRMRALKARAFPDGDPDRTFHDIRGTLASSLMDASCTDAETASVMGWVMGSRNGGESVAMTRNYVRRSRQLAINAYQKLWAMESGETGNVVPMRRSG